MIKVGEKNVYRGVKITVSRQFYRAEKGAFVAEAVKHPGVAAVLPIKNDGKIVLVKQYRYIVDETLLEIPAGTLREGEKPEECARRELAEETGYIAEKLKYLGSFYASPGTSTELVYSYLAKVSSAEAQRLEVDEEISVVEISLKDLLTIIKEGKIKDSKTLATLLLYLLKETRLPEYIFEQTSSYLL